MTNVVNLVVMQCNLTKDPECKDINGQRVCKLSLASNRVYKEKKETCFIEAYCWSGLNKVIEAYLNIGSHVLIEGRIKLDSWVSKEGENRYKHVIIINQLTMLPSGHKKQEENNEI